VAEVAFPNAAEQTLISYVHPDLVDTCKRRTRIYPAEVDSITCGAGDLPFDYSLFSTAEAMKAAYDEDVAQAETPPVPGGSCEEGTLEESYDIGETPGGRLNCREHISSAGLQFHVIEWTNDQLLVIGYLSNRPHTWQELIEFWSQQAGPFSPA